jgi:hypothetical protein
MLKYSNEHVFHLSSFAYVLPMICVQQRCSVFTRGKKNAFIIFVVFDVSRLNAPITADDDEML